MIGGEAPGWFFETNVDGLYVSRFENDMLLYGQTRVGVTPPPLGVVSDAAFLERQCHPRRQGARLGQLRRDRAGDPVPFGVDAAVAAVFGERAARRLHGAAVLPAAEFFRCARGVLVCDYSLTWMAGGFAAAAGFLLSRGGRQDCRLSHDWPPHTAGVVVFFIAGMAVAEPQPHFAVIGPRPGLAADSLVGRIRAAGFGPGQGFRAPAGDARVDGVGEARRARSVSDPGRRVAGGRIVRLPRRQGARFTPAASSTRAVPSCPSSGKAARAAALRDARRRAASSPRERWTGAPVLAGFRRGAGAVLWVAATPGEQGYERFPYLLQALADLGLEPPFRSSALVGLLRFLVPHARRSGLLRRALARGRHRRAARRRLAFLRARPGARRVSRRT